MSYGASAATGGMGSNQGLNQMLIQNPSGLDVSASASAVDELANIKLDEIAELFEDEKIKHERGRREDLKRLEQDNKK